MPDEDNKILKYNFGKKSLKVLFKFDLDIECLIKKHTHAKVIQKNLTQREKLSMSLLAGYWAFKLYQNIRDHCHHTGKFRGAAHSICNLRYKVIKEIPVVAHNRSTYDDHFIIKQLAEEFHGQFDAQEKMWKNILSFSTN